MVVVWTLYYLEKMVGQIVSYKGVEFLDLLLGEAPSELVHVCLLQV